MGVGGTAKGRSNETPRARQSGQQNAEERLSEQSLSVDRRFIDLDAGLRPCY
jgi:hypothetical protein